ncbi:hypothetical protein BleG1_0385 [Shouchella lehensis G1]|uniref:Uncharacterized protein n=1 Tax=Shouchella lehensis G1 TaxID=1246626 RepID=A0A060LXI8_9BACI|nr:hypothetical protein BleG1_0385 [Shouchella lehensis G1]
MLDKDEIEMVERELAFLECLKKERCQPSCMFIPTINEEIREVRRAVNLSKKR